MAEQQESSSRFRFTQLVNVTAWLLIGSSWAIVTVAYPHLPESIPSHFDLQGNVNGYGPKETAILPPFIFTILLVFLLLCSRFSPALLRLRYLQPQTLQRQLKGTNRVLLVFKLFVAALAVLTSTSIVYPRMNTLVLIAPTFLAFVLVVVIWGRYL